MRWSVWRRARADFEPTLFLPFHVRSFSMSPAPACVCAPARPQNEFKRATVALADISSAGVFEGYASLFGVMDLGGDIIERGAFRDTLDVNGAAHVKMLWQHNQTEPIGVWLSIVEDARGLKVRGQLDLAVARAREALALMKSGAVDGLSIGFRAERATKNASGVRLLHRIDLVEISLVTFPMAPKARVTSVKIAPSTRAEMIIPGSLAARRTDLYIKYLRLRSKAAGLRVEMELKRAALRQAFDVRYSANQPHVPAGVREGGQWSGSGGGGAHTATPSASAPKIGAGGNDTRVISDANPDAIVPGARYAAGERRPGEGQPRRIGNTVGEVTAEQQSRLDSANTQLIIARDRVRTIDPAWQPSPGMSATEVEGEIQRMNAERAEADARYLELINANANAPDTSPQTDIIDPQNTKPTIPLVDILVPSGTPIGTVEPGATANIRTVSSSEFDLLTKDLLDGATPIATPIEYYGQWWQRLDGSVFGIRMSGQNGATIDVVKNNNASIPRDMKVHQR